METRLSVTSSSFGENQYPYSRQAIMGRIVAKKETSIVENYEDHFEHEDYSVHIGPDSNPWG